MPKTIATMAATTPIAVPTFAPVLSPLLSLFMPALLEADWVDADVGSDVGEETADTEVMLSGGGVTVMTVYDADEVEGVKPSTALLATVLGAADNAEVWLHCPLPLESV
jgi:hypothetical protein